MHVWYLALVPTNQPYVGKNLPHKDPVCCGFMTNCDTPGWSLNFLAKRGPPWILSHSIHVWYTSRHLPSFTITINHINHSCMDGRGIKVVECGFPGARTWPTTFKKLPWVLCSSEATGIIFMGSLLTIVFGVLNLIVGIPEVYQADGGDGYLSSPSPSPSPLSSSSSSSSSSSLLACFSSYIHHTLRLICKKSIQKA